MFHLTAEEREALEAASSYEEAAMVAIDHLRRLCIEYGPLVQICGPISTGGLGSRERNLKRLSRYVDACHKMQEFPIFNQLHFEGIVKRFSPEHGPQSYDPRILPNFYEPVLRQGFITRLYFLPDWKTSEGAKYERWLGERFKIEIQEYPEEWHKSARIQARLQARR